MRVLLRLPDRFLRFDVVLHRKGYLQMSDLYIMATMIAKPDRIASLRDRLLPAVEAFRKEPGCLAYTLLEDKKEPGRFITYERWTDEAALKAHMSAPTLQSLKPLLPALLAQEMTQDFLDALVIL
jgi:quinol monooxygenase YgiN